VEGFLNCPKLILIDPFIKVDDVNKPLKNIAFDETLYVDELTLTPFSKAEITGLCAKLLAVSVEG
jgi:hypothetical protein